MSAGGMLTADVGWSARPSDDERVALDQALLTAHARDDGAELVRLYARAADMAAASEETDACCFYLTHAYVFALEAGAPEAGGLHARLMAFGREE